MNCQFFSLYILLFSFNRSRTLLNTAFKILYYTAFALLNTNKSCMTWQCRWIFCTGKHSLLLQQHRTGLAKKIWQMESREDVDKWISERKMLEFKLNSFLKYSVFLDFLSNFVLVFLVFPNTLAQKSMESI